MKYKKLITISIIISILTYHSPLIAFAEDKNTVESFDSSDQTHNVDDEAPSSDEVTDNQFDEIPGIDLLLEDSGDTEDTSGTEGTEPEKLENSESPDKSMDDENNEKDEEPEIEVLEDEKAKDKDKDDSNEEEIHESSISICGFAPTIVLDEDGYLTEEYCLCYETTFNAYDALTVEEAISLIIDTKNDFSNAEKSALDSLNISDTCPPDLKLDIYYNQDQSEADKVQASYTLFDEDGNEMKKKVTLYEKDIK